MPFMMSHFLDASRRPPRSRMLSGAGRLSPCGDGATRRATSQDAMTQEPDGEKSLRESRVALIVMAVAVLAVLLFGAVTLLAHYG